MCIINFFIPVFQSMLAAYLFLIIIKLIAFCRIYRFFGDYCHPEEKDDDTNFKVSHTSGWNFISPIPNISITITRKGKSTPNQDWHGIFNSDILHIFYFKGIYIINDPGVHDSDGWHEIYLFEKHTKKKKPIIRIGFNLHYLDEKEKRWLIDRGYYIEKK